MGSCANGGGYYHYSYAVVRGCDRSISILHRRYHCCAKWTIIHPKLSPELSLLTSMCPAAPLQLKHSCMAFFRYISPPLALSPLIWLACFLTCTILSASKESEEDAECSSLVQNLSFGKHLPCLGGYNFEYHLKIENIFKH